MVAMDEKDQCHEDFHREQGCSRPMMWNPALNETPPAVESEDKPPRPSYIWRPQFQERSEEKLDDQEDRTEDEEDEEIDVVNSYDDDVSEQSGSTEQTIPETSTNPQNLTVSHEVIGNDVSNIEYERVPSMSPNNDSEIPERKIVNSRTTERTILYYPSSFPDIPNHSFLASPETLNNFPYTSYTDQNIEIISGKKGEYKLSNYSDTDKESHKDREYLEPAPYFNYSTGIRFSGGWRRDETATELHYSSPVVSPLHRHGYSPKRRDFSDHKEKELSYKPDSIQVKNRKIDTSSSLSSYSSSSSLGSSESLHSNPGNPIHRKQVYGYDVGSTGSMFEDRGEQFGRRRSDGSGDYMKRYADITRSSPTDSTESVFISKEDLLRGFGRRQSLGAVDYMKTHSEAIGSFPTGSSESVFTSQGDILQRRLTLGSTDFRKRPLGSLSSYTTESTESISSGSEDMLQRTSSFASPDTAKHFIAADDYEHDKREEVTASLCPGQRLKLSPVSTETYSTNSNDSYSSSKDSADRERYCPADDKKGHEDSADENRIESVIRRSPNYNVDAGAKKVVQERESVLVKARNSKMNNTFTDEDVTLRSRVLILLWVLLGERRLREVGYPSEPVHRLLWRAVDVCCSVAGVKSAAAVPLNADHDCGVDMACFRDHTHRFLEVCAPTREHWKQFGWASLTVDAVMRKIYDEELAPLLRLQSLPPDVQKAAVYLAQLDRPPVTVHSIKQNVILPAKKKRGRPAKIAHKVDQGGRIERVMLWRFLLNLLEDPSNAPCIHWVQREEGIFRILNTDWLARLWGRRHGNPRMTYEKMARAMRTYYRSKVLQPVPRQRNLPRKLVYKFNPAVIQKVAAMKLSCSAFSGRGMNYNK